jgi:hypothetical protein
MSTKRQAKAFGSLKSDEGMAKIVKKEEGNKQQTRSG